MRTVFIGSLPLTSIWSSRAGWCLAGLGWESRTRERLGRTLVTGSLLTGPGPRLTGWLGSLRRMTGGLINRGEGGGSIPRNRGPPSLNSLGGPLGLANLGL